MNKPAKIITAIIAFASYTINAQMVTKTETLDGNTLTISMDEKVDALMNSLEKECKNTDNEPIIEKNHTSVISIDKPVKELTIIDVCRKNPKVSGYKIQLTVVKSNDEANEVKAYFRRRFPRIKVETDASLRPNYKILAGSYFSKQSSSADLAKIREYFKNATPVQSVIFCVEGK